LAIKEAEGDKGKAAEIAKVTRQTLYNKMRFCR